MLQDNGSIISVEVHLRRIG